MCKDILYVGIGIRSESERYQLPAHHLATEDQAASPVTVSLVMNRPSLPNIPSIKANQGVTANGVIPYNHIIQGVVQPD